ncbi:MAG: aminotransferase class I/II-fold pyridoxal phosphate-dependent enzyme, partial [Thermaerobacter sp.]|nr:aminotransferase class I/II-fold pyridoxal phosphate-dependent enzyme [Thermaerobacter sp.]
MHMSQRALKINPSPTLALDAKAKALRQEGVDVVNFGVGEPDFDTPEHIKEAAIRALREGRTKYTPVAGIPELRRAIVEKLHRDNALDYAEGQIVVSAGAKHSLYNAFQVLVDPGDEVVIPAPYWVTYPEQVRLAGGIPVFVPTRAEDGFRLDPA